MRVMERVESQHALGGEVQIGLTMSDTTTARQLFDTLWLELFLFEKAASRFLENSELTILNRYASHHSISPRFRNALLAAKQSALLSGGLFNPFVLPAVQRTGYVHSVTDSKKSIALDVRKRQIASTDQLQIGDTWVSIPPGSALDLGGCGKGHIVDVLAAIARQDDGIVGGWIEADGDIFAWGRDEKDDLITIAVQSASGTDNDFYVVIPESGLGIATSGTFARPNVTYTDHAHHIIDPRTGKPAISDTRLATVCAATCLEADVLASCAIISGMEKAPGYLSGHGATDWILQTQSGLADVPKTASAGSHILTIREVRHA